MAKIIVIASNVNDVVIVTPRRRHAVRGIEAESIDEVEPTTLRNQHARRQLRVVDEIIRRRRRPVL